MPTPDSHGWLKQPVTLNFAVPVLSVGAALIIGRWLDLYLRAAPVSLFICAVMFSYTTKPGGLGMGLSISRSIIDGRRGQLWATANPGHGATFHCALPGTR
jgi:hypothetical protein